MHVTCFLELHAYSRIFTVVEEPKLHPISLIFTVVHVSCITLGNYSRINSMQMSEFKPRTQKMIYYL